MKFTKPALMILLCIVGSLTAQEGVQEGASRILELTNPAAKAVITLNQSRGHLTVVGYEGSSILLKAWNRRGENDETLLNTIEFTEKDNRIYIFAPLSAPWIDIELRVPLQASLFIEKREGNTTVRYITGEVSVSQESGDIQITHLSGSAVLNTVDGDIIVRFSEITGHTPMVVSSFSGNIEAEMPGQVVSLRVRCEAGTVNSELPLVRENEEDTGQSTRFVSSEGDGPEILFWTVQGNIRIRKKGNL